MLDLYGTLGPACSDVETLAAMFEAGMTGLRLNLSHVTLPHAASQLAAMHEAAKRCGKRAQLLIDMQGPELRVGALPEPLELSEGCWMMGNCCWRFSIPARILLWPASCAAACCAAARASRCRAPVCIRQP